MLDDFKTALARVQSDFGFYIECQTNAAAALAPYDLSPDERLALSDADRLADVLKQALGIRSITITISGSHDWVNRTKKSAAITTVDQANAAVEIDGIKRARTNEERTEAALRLMELIG